ncbi:D-alanine--D-alanine ligase [Pseudomonas sp. MWU16-30317]|uniref:D-alanine--D-alanine ligase family protein n=1 Tax=Pseudomonas sp. MWU16-30317 TaxID=2878095 RepID=UPI0031F99F20
MALLFGGPGRERDISFASARRVLAALRSKGHEVTAVDLSIGPLTFLDEARSLGDRDVSKQVPDSVVNEGQVFRVINDLVPADYDMVFLALHGSPGEDGLVQAALDLRGILYTGSRFAACARTFDKHSAKQWLHLAGIDTPEWMLIRRGEALPDVAHLGLPLVVKPRSEGSTIGISLVQSHDDLAAAVARARLFTEDVLIERYIAGRELTVGVLNGAALAVGEILLAPLQLFDYVSKYQPGRVLEVFPARTTAELTQEVQRVAVAAHCALELGCYSRVDIRLDAQLRPWVLEVNSLPGLTQNSLLPQSALAAGIGFEALCETIIRKGLV